MSAIGSQIGQFIERKRAEGLVRESEARFRQLADAMPQIVWAARPDGFIDYYNERWYEFTGFRATMKEVNIAGSRSCIRTMPGAVRTPITIALRSGTVYEIEYRFKDRKTGGYRWFLGRAYPVRDEQGVFPVGSVPVRISTIRNGRRSRVDFRPRRAPRWRS